MSDPIKLPKQLRAQGWKVKVYDNERLEPPSRHRHLSRAGLADWSEREGYHDPLRWSVVGH